MTQPALLPEITVHCFTCPHIVTGSTPDEAHDLMEAHYRDKHTALIERLIKGVA